MLDQLLYVKHRVGAKVWVAHFNSESRIRLQNCPACNNTGELVIKPTGFDPFTVACPCTFVGKPFIKSGAYEPKEVTIERITIEADGHYYEASESDFYAELTEDDIFTNAADCQEYIDSELNNTILEDPTNVF